MPSWIALAPWTRPSHEMLVIRFPQHEIGRMAFDRLRRHVDSATFTTSNGIHRVARERSILRIGLHVEVDNAVFGDIRVITGDESFDQNDHVGNHSGRSWHQLRFIHRFDGNRQSKQTGIRKKRLGIEIRDRHGIFWIDLHTIRQRSGFLGFKHPTGSDFHLVFAAAIRIGILGHVSDIRDVHHVTNLVSHDLQSTPEYIGVQKGTEVPDVRIVIDGWTT